MLIQIKRDGDNFSIKEISKQNSLKQIGNISKNNFIMNTEKPEFDLIKDLITIPFEGKNKKLIPIINKLYQQFEFKHPKYVKSFSIPLFISNESYALCITRDYIKLVNANEQKSSQSRVHVDYFTKNQFFNDVGTFILYREKNPNLYGLWLDKARDIYKEQVNKFLNNNII